MLLGGDGSVGLLLLLLSLLYGEMRGLCDKEGIYAEEQQKKKRQAVKKMDRKENRDD